jgi:long-chain acyl-CoA synthetase
MSATVLDLIRAHAARAPEHPALVVARAGEAEPERIGYGELVARVDRLTARLLAGGVRPAQRTGLVARQGAGFIELALAILAADACFVPIPDDHAGAVLDAFAERASLHWVVLEREADFERLARPTPKAVDGNGERDFAALRPAYLRFTSGTTSRRKGVILGHAAILARLAAANRGLGIGPADRVLWLLPMAHHFVVSILLYLSRGAAILLPAGSLARPILELAARERATVLYASPYHMSLLAKDASELGLTDLGGVGIRDARLSVAEGRHRLGRWSPAVLTAAAGTSRARAQHVAPHGG